ncbi:hypothetical protein FNJ84_02295 [Paracoccus sp. M683]|uniref:DUF6173 family protein n=1 Tax=Paracoccus sp. M683 TaxID=2594268 RepID=UPI00117FBFEF|nr:DUF6173 family protein [Paracoccus sp. M683]TRW99525.1 hypothetical protein FNJ84_02295 [Paracoccus sp. M683]
MIFKSKKTRTEPTLRKSAAPEPQPKVTKPAPKSSATKSAATRSAAAKPSAPPKSAAPSVGPAFTGAPVIVPTDAAVPALAPDLWPTGDEADQATLHAAEEVFNHLLARVKDFQANLPDNHELGIQLANFGSERALHVRGMGFRNPNIIEFYGLLDGDKKVAVVQHVSQLNFLLVAVPPPAQQPPYRIGFGAELHTGPDQV